MSGVRSLILCDDIRREITGKDIIIGAYAGSIIVTEFPFTLNIAIWLEYEPEKIGGADIHLQLSYSGKAPSKIKVSINASELTAVGIPLTRLAVNGDAEGELKIELSSDGSSWKLLKTYSVKKGQFASLPTPGTAPPPSST